MWSSDGQGIYEWCKYFDTKKTNQRQKRTAIGFGTPKITDKDTGK